MRFSFCKNSVFCVLFLLFFLMGTICGVFLLRCLIVADRQWLAFYCCELDRLMPTSLFLRIWFQLIPFLVALVIRLSSCQDKLYPVLFFIRGCLITYSIGALLINDVVVTRVLLRNVLMLPAFYAFCRWLWCEQS